ncbi:hypothetical protein QJS66_15635 [Kocuria rhizophila]|nr:hypothetical protein QJS66_15635 [Kocuria rhizophila]
MAAPEFGQVKDPPPCAARPTCSAPPRTVVVRAQEGASLTDVLRVGLAAVRSGSQVVSSAPPLRCGGRQRALRHGAEPRVRRRVRARPGRRFLAGPAGSALGPARPGRRRPGRPPRRSRPRDLPRGTAPRRRTSRRTSTRCAPAPGHRPDRRGRGGRRGGVEIMYMLAEQAVSITMHRFGNHSQSVQARGRAGALTPAALYLALGGLRVADAGRPQAGRCGPDFEV